MVFKYVVDNNCFNVLNAINKEGYAPIHLAVLSESLEILKEFVLLNDARLDLNIKDTRYGYTALHYAALRSSRTLMVNTLTKSREVDKNSASDRDITPVQLSVANKNYMSTICLVSQCFFLFCR